MSKSKSSPKSTTAAAVARVQGAVAVQNGGQVPKGSYVGRMQRTVAQTVSVKGARASKSIFFRRTFMSVKSDNDNHSNQLNPNNDEYWHSRGEEERPADWEDRASESGTRDD